MKSANFMLDYACNQDCLFCLNEWRGKKSGKLLTLNERKRALERLREEGVEFLTISGGEPLVDKDFPAVAEYASQIGFQVMVQTNGQLLNDKLLMQLHGKVKIFEISLEGMGEVHNSMVQRKFFEKAVEKIRLAQKHGFMVFTNFTITKLNAPFVVDYVRFLEQLGVPVANFTKLYLNGRAKEQRSKLELSESEYEAFLRKISDLQKTTNILLNIQSGFSEELLEKAGISASSCGAGVSEVALNPDGSIKPCPSWPKSYGNILNDSLQEAVQAAAEIRGCSSCSGCLVNDIVQFEEIKIIS